MGPNRCFLDPGLVALGEARVLDTQFFGAMTSVAVEGEFPLEGTLRVQSSSRDVDFGEGDRVRLYGPEGAMWLLPQDTPQA